MERERTRTRFSAPIPGFTHRLRTAIGQNYNSAYVCGEALGLRYGTLGGWLRERTVPRHVDDLVMLSTGLGVSVDWLVFGRDYAPRDWVEDGAHRRLRRVILEQYGSLMDFRRRLNVTGNMIRRWTKGTSRPDLFYLRHIATMLDVSLDWLQRGESWTQTNGRRVVDPRMQASVSVVRAIERMAHYEPDPVIVAALREQARRAGRVRGPVVAEHQYALWPGGAGPQ